MKRWNRVEK
uniref:Uncharacterized protein n=1 Tax=Anguilla anguilla TaxID=7936 RepID=A0A0E9P7E7_ANGAN